MARAGGVDVLGAGIDVVSSFEMFAATVTSARFGAARAH
jgi:hypothetical protein